jgi:hypothetical protein
MRKFAVVGFCAVAMAWAQECRASLNGVITDAQGAVVPSARVSKVQVDTRATISRVTSSVGQCIVPLLPPGETGRLYKAEAARIDSNVKETTHAV